MVRNNRRWVRRLRGPLPACCVLVRLVRIETRGSTKGNSLAAAAALQYASLLTANVEGHRLRCVHDCLCVLDSVLRNVVVRECSQQYMQPTNILTSLGLAV